MTSIEQSGRDDFLLVSADPIDPNVLLGHVGTPRSGAVALFLGTVRNHSPGKEGVTHLEYEAYEGVVVAKIAEIVREAHDMWPLDGLAVQHRVGPVEVGEVSVAVAAGSGHRAEAFAAARYVIDELKSRVPIWKKEHWPGGAEWVREDLEHRR